MAPNTTGNASEDSDCSAALVVRALELSRILVRVGGFVVLKVFHGDSLPELTNMMRDGFAQCSVIKPEGSRKQSREWFLVGRNMRREFSALPDPNDTSRHTSHGYPRAADHNESPSPMSVRDSRSRGSTPLNERRTRKLRPASLLAMLRRRSPVGTPHSHRSGDNRNPRETAPGGGSTKHAADEQVDSNDPLALRSPDGMADSRQAARGLESAPPTAAGANANRSRSHRRRDQAAAAADVGDSLGDLDADSSASKRESRR
jgi:hypothetical protein